MGGGLANATAVGTLEVLERCRKSACAALVIAHGHADLSNSGSSSGRLEEAQNFCIQTPGHLTILVCSKWNVSGCLY